MSESTEGPGIKLGILDPPKPEAPKPQAEPEPKLEAKSETPPVRTEAKQTDNDGVKRWEAVVIKKSASERLGIEVFSNKAGVVIKLVRAGAVEDWNTKAEDSEQIKAGTVIVKVNCETDTSKVLDALEKSTELRLALKRLVGNFTIMDADSSKKLGIDVGVGDMIVTKVHPGIDGVVNSWNAGCEPGLEVMVGDQLVGVNGVSGTPAELMKLIQDRQSKAKVSLTFSHGQ